MIHLMSLSKVEVKPMLNHLKKNIGIIGLSIFIGLLVGYSAKHQDIGIVMGIIILVIAVCWGVRNGKIKLIKWKNLSDDEKNNAYIASILFLLFFLLSVCIPLCILG
jgi:hypothetical protein